MLETAVQQQVRLAMARLGGLPMRNNVGVAVDDNGRYVRYGLMNESKQQNEKFKSSDIVGPIPIVIQPHHVGQTIGVFSVLECKHSDWTYSPNDARSAAQWRFIQLMQSVGCIGGFITDARQIDYHIRQASWQPSENLP